MSDDRWQRVADLYQSAHDRAPEERSSFVSEASAGDSDLRREVESLLAEDDAAIVLDAPIGATAHSLLADNSAMRPGSFIGPYRIDNLLGSGGMGEVYRARDTKLNRDVAIKILPPAFAGDPERLARFKREAQLLASLNHPNIAAIYGFEDSAGVHALILELVEGPTLADRIADGSLHIDETLAIARQIADALECAHEAGIIHRDLKPANIKVRDDGTVKVLDFGLAKLAEPVGRTGLPAMTQSPTITTPAMTTAGIILGTAAYMSPEQAKAKPADKRSDIWAFGCVLYEMLTGKRAFEGEDVSDTLANVLKGEPDWTVIPPDVPPPIAQLMKACLEKNRPARIADASTLSYVLRQPAIDVRAAAKKSTGRTVAVAAITLVLGGTLGALAIRDRTAKLPPATLPISRLVIQIGSGNQFSTVGRHLLAFSPDGSRLVYVTNNQLYLRRLDSLDAVPIRGTLGASNANDVGPPGASAGRSPFFSPDGKWVGFWQANKLKKVLVDGGVPVDICEAHNPLGASWAPDDTILFGEGRDGIYRVSAAGGNPTLVIKSPGGSAHGPQLLPGGRAVLFTLRNDNDVWDEAAIVVQSLDSDRRDVLLRGTDARYLDTGHLVYVANGTLFAVPFDVMSRRVSGGPVALVEHVAQSPAQSGAAHYAISATGSLAYVSGTFTQQRLTTLFWVDRQGHETKLNAPGRQYVYPRISPDERRIALGILAEYQNLWIWDVGRETLEPMTAVHARQTSPAWMPDGHRLVFSAAGIWSIDVDTGAPPTLLLPPSSLPQLPTSVAPDGRLVFTTGDGNRIDLLTPSTSPRIDPLVGRSGMGAINGEVSPDGTMLAYQTNESGQFQVVVRAFSTVAGWHRQVSTGGGTRPAWSGDGRELFYVTPTGALMHVLVTPGSPASFGLPSPILEGPYLYTLPGIAGRMYDVSRKSGRFLMMKAEPDQQPHSDPDTIVVVQNWIEELKQKVPAR
jgi:serine/threonine protein kinase/Tol biopolymer transport system component